MCKYNRYQREVIANCFKQLGGIRWLSGGKPDWTMGRLTIDIYIHHLNGHSASTEMAAEFMGTRHPHTTKNYLERAIKEGLIEPDESDPKKMPPLLVATDELIETVESLLVENFDKIRLCMQQVISLGEPDEEDGVLPWFTKAA